MFEKLLPDDRIGIDLDRITQCDHQKPRAFLGDVIMHLLDQSFGDAPRLFPIIVGGLEIGHVFHSDFGSRGRGLRFTCSRWCLRGWRRGGAPLVSPFSQTELANELGVMN